MSKESDKVYKEMKEYHYGTQNRIGMWDGGIVSIEDPSKTGKVQVRVHLIHGSEEDTPDQFLPWAEVAYTGGGYDWGEYDPPPVGTSVLVGFKMGDEQYPVIVGCVRGKPDDNQKLRAKKFDDVEPVWLTPAGELETPKDVFNLEEEGNRHPTRRVWRKSFKGHTITVEEKDGSEYLKIIDRAGQIIEMNGPLSADTNKEISAQRGTRSADTDTQVEQSQMQESRGFIRMIDSSGQEILLDGRAGNEDIIIRNQNRSGSRTQTLKFHNKRGEEYVELQDYMGSNIKLTPGADEKITIEDYNGSKIYFDKNKNIVLAPAGTLIIDSGRDQNVVIGGDYIQNIKGNNVIDVLGNREVTIAGGNSINAMGSTTFVNAGTVSGMIGGVPLFAPLPVPPSYAVDLISGKGGYRLIALAGTPDAIFLGAGAAGALGSFSIDALGNILLDSKLGITLSTLLPGPPATIKLGSITSTEVAILGTKFISDFVSFLIMLKAYAVAAVPLGAGAGAKLAKGIEAAFAFTPTFKDILTANEGDVAGLASKAAVMLAWGSQKVALE